MFETSLDYKDSVSQKNKIRKKLQFIYFIYSFFKALKFGGLLYAG